MIEPIQPPPKNVDSLNLVIFARELLRWCFEVYRRLRDPDLVYTDKEQTLTNKTVPDLQYDLLGPARVLTEGLTYWDTDSKTLAVKLNGPDVSLQLGQEQHLRATNKTGSDIPNGTVVRISGAFSKRATIAPAKADADATGVVIGMTTEEIKNNNSGYVTTMGIVHDVNTAGITAGTNIYLSAASAGAYTSTAPAFPNYCIEVGTVLHEDATTGEVFIHPKVEVTNHVMLNHLGAKDASIGAIGAGNYSEFESDGTLVCHGNATTYDDSMSAVFYQKTGGSALTLDVLDGSIYQYRMDQLDEVHSQIQFSHRYRVGTPVYLHIHLCNKAAVGATAYNVGIEVEYLWANLNTAFPTATTLTPITNCSFQNAAALTHKVFSIATITPTAAQGGISSILIMRVKRVVATTQDLSGTNIFILGIDCHTEQDTMGSRQEFVK